MIKIMDFRKFQKVIIRESTPPTLDFCLTEQVYITRFTVKFTHFYEL